MQDGALSLFVYTGNTDYKMPNIAGMILVAESSVFIRKDLKVNSISVRKHGNVELLTIDISGVLEWVINRTRQPTHRCRLHPGNYGRVEE